MAPGMGILIQRAAGCHAESRSARDRSPKSGVRQTIPYVSRPFLLLDVRVTFSWGEWPGVDPGVPVAHRMDIKVGQLTCRDILGFGSQTTSRSQ